MKTYKHLWEKLISEENFNAAYHASMKNKRNQRLIRQFNKNPKENLEAVRKMVIEGRFHTSPYKEREIYEPKRRTIYKLPYSPDRIVQHAIMRVLEPILTNLMMENTFACIKKRGQLKASIKCSEYVRKYKYCLKCDIKKFYPSINQHILSEKFHRIIKDDKFMALVDDIIFSYPGGYNCPIGNYMSQWCGNYYLSFMDNFILHELKPKGYERYCDDFMLFDNDKKKLHECKRRIADFIKRELELEFSKAEVFDTKQGVDFCGYRHFGKYVLVRKSTSLRLKRRFRNIEKNLASGEGEIEHMRGQVASGNGVLKHACSHRLRQSINYETIWETVNSKESSDENSNTKGRNELSGT